MAVAAQKAKKSGNFRGSPRERGYDSKWDRLSVKFRKMHPFCLFCSQQGRDSLTDIVDHIVPVADRPDLIHEWSNLCALCTRCHGRKFGMETYARENGLLDALPSWVKDIEIRPQQFR